MVVPGQAEARLQKELERAGMAGGGQAGAMIPESLSQEGPPPSPLALTQGEVGQAPLHESELAVALMPSRDERPDSGDQRELVPAASPSRIEDLLLQVIQENHHLRLRLDQMETQSSWHSGARGSGRSFGSPEGNASKGQGGQLVSVGQQPSSTGLMGLSGVEGLAASFSDGIGSQMLGLAQGVFQGRFSCASSSTMWCLLPSGVSAGLCASGYEGGLRSIGPMEEALASGAGMGNQADLSGSVEVVRPYEAGREIGNRGVGGFCSPRGQASGCLGQGLLRKDILCLRMER